MNARLLSPGSGRRSSEAITLEDEGCFSGAAIATWGNERHYLACQSVPGQAEKGMLAATIHLPGAEVVRIQGETWAPSTAFTIARGRVPGVNGVRSIAGCCRSPVSLLTREVT
jgi:hypothetical protein